MQIPFSYPRRGLDGQFTTFRLGKAWATRVNAGDKVELVDSKTKKVLKHASVKSVALGTLEQMAHQHGEIAHNWKERPLEERSPLLIASMKKRYPPGRVRDDSLVTVIFLEAEENEVHTRGNQLAQP